MKISPDVFYAQSLLTLIKTCIVELELFKGHYRVRTPQRLRILSSRPTRATLKGPRTELSGRPVSRHVQGPDSIPTTARTKDSEAAAVFGSMGIPAHKRLRQGDHKQEANLGFKARPCLKEQKFRMWCREAHICHSRTGKPGE